MVAVDLEIGFRAEASLHVREDVGGEVHHDPARVAHGVVVDAIGEVVHGATVAEVDVSHHTELLQRVERPVHRAEVHVRCRGSHPFGEDVGGDVVVVGDERRDDGPARARDARALRAQDVEQLRLAAHRRRAYRSLSSGPVAARCPTCGEQALSDDARFCVGCGSPLPEAPQDLAAEEPFVVPAVVPVLPEVEPEESFVDDAAPEPVASDSGIAALLAQLEEPAQPLSEPAVPVAAPPEVAAERSLPRPARQTAPPVSRALPPFRDPQPTVPVPVVVAGVVALLAVLLLLLLAS